MLYDQYVNPYLKLHFDGEEDVIDIGEDDNSDQSKEDEKDELYES